MVILGIETSCDDTGVAIVEDGHRVLANRVSSQPEHQPFGGVVPEIAARRHVEALPGLLEAVLATADKELADIDAIAITRGPGLIGALLAGWCFGRGLARSCRLPYVGVHHLAAHVHGALMPSLAAGVEVPYPLLALIVSGGHTALYRVDRGPAFERLGATRDDAAGEAFDKIAKLLELGFPGGPIIDRLAADGDSQRFSLPRADLGLEFSFSGVKTAARRLALANSLPPASPEDQRVRDLAASFQCAVVDMLIDTTSRAAREQPSSGLVLAGGVAANRELRMRFATLAGDLDLPLYVSPRELSTDNAAMVAGAGYGRLGQARADELNLPARASWPLGR
ncbi:MAG TPA: tRNA (adenosine(37)-N6)-threonylcarbamoyltransferase complex transferase subunit TsaD [Acidobacteriota bacterium]|nr:tRNA (adenosine(37)-N6)-threonylcarbamoyltransferase complex transferase subunit TsaD [Acidobacteriota bacterium]